MGRLERRVTEGCAFMLGCQSYSICLLNMRRTCGQVMSISQTTAEFVFQSELEAQLTNKSAFTQTVNGVWRGLEAKPELYPHPPPFTLSQSLIESTLFSKDHAQLLTVWELCLGTTIFMKGYLMRRVSFSAVNTIQRTHFTTLVIWCREKYNNKKPQQQ